MVTLNRIPHYLYQIEEYWFRGTQRRFARDSGVSESTFSRILHGTTKPHYADICLIVDHIERKLNIKLDPREVYRIDPS